uniref:Ankyrin repeat and LEM domain containing 1 n=1 Tax=Sciurus vulgaris TaxID=55149 RepID=A0A8D2DVQ4_SCIVU
MGAVAGLAQRLRAAVQEEEPGAVEELLRRGADPNLVLSDGAAAMHLAAGARHPRGLRCLGALLRGGGDPNARSAEALTPLHVAAAWGCRRGLELLLSQGADPALRDQDGLRPLDLAVQQGHPDCARLLRELGSRTTDPAEAQEPESGREPGTQPSRADSSGVRLEAGPHLPDSLEFADKDGNSDAPLGCWHCDSESSFVTAVEVSGDEDSAPDTSPWARSWPQTTQELPGLHPIQGTPRPGSGPQLVHGGVPRDPSFRLHLSWALRITSSSPHPRTSFPLPGPEFSGHSPELAKALRTGHIPDSQADEDALAQQFERPDPTQRWREGIVKSSFTYLLLDPRYLGETQDLPARAFSLTPAECFQTFVRAIFYVGKGTRARPDVHLWEALGYRGQPRRQACPKVRQILDIWDSGRGVVSLHCFQHVVAVEAYTREACLVDALGIQTLTNQKQGHYYGVVADWPPARRRRLGVHLLHRALLVFLAEGQRELRPQDIQARG